MSVAEVQNAIDSVVQQLREDPAVIHEADGVAACLEAIKWQYLGRLGDSQKDVVQESCQLLAQAHEHAAATARLIRTLLDLLPVVRQQF